MLYINILSIKSNAEIHTFSIILMDYFIFEIDWSEKKRIRMQKNLILKLKLTFQ